MKEKTGVISSMMRHHDIVYLIVAILVAFGFYGLTKMNKQEFPEFTIRQGVVVGVYPGANPQEIQEQLTKPLENFLFTFQEIDREKTYSYTRNSMVYVFVELNKNVKNKDQAWSKIRHGIKDFKLSLPSGVLAVVVNDDFGNSSALLITIESNDKTYRELEKYTTLLSDRLRKIPSIANAKIFGQQQEVINVYIEQEKLASYGISSQTLMANLFSQGFVTSSGSIDNDSISAPIHINTHYKSEQEIAQQIVYSDLQGHIIRLKDIAKVERSYEDASSFISENGQKALVLSIEMRPGNNIVELGEEVDAVLNDFEKTIPDSVKLYRITDLPKVVNLSVLSFLRDLLLAIIVVIAVMLILFPLRSALVAAIGIPIAVAITLAFMYVFNVDLNTVTLAALIVTLGMIVDNSIVVIDGYIENINAGYSRWNAAVSSAKNYLPPLLLATIAICGIFYPFLVTFTGVFADFIVLFPFTITIALFVSLAIAILVIPFLEFKWIKPQKANRKESWLSKRQNHFFGFLQTTYEKCLESCFRHPKMVIAIAFASVALAFCILFFTLEIQLMPKAARDCFAVEIYLPQGSSLHQTQAICDSVEQMLRKEKTVEMVTAFVGSSSPRFMATYAPGVPSKNYGQLIVNTSSEKATEELLKKYTNNYINYFPNAVVRFKQLDYQAVRNPIEIAFHGYNPKELHQQADKLMAYMRTLDDLIWVHDDWGSNQPYLRIDINQDEAMRLGITKSMLALHLASNFGGVPLTTIWEDDYGIAVKLKIKRDEAPNFKDIENQLIATAIPGVCVPLRQVASVSADWQPSQIVTRNGVYCLTVGSDLAYGLSQPKVMKKINTYIEKQIKPDMPSSVHITFGGLTGVNKDTLPEIAVGLIASVLIIFFFLVFNFKKISLAVLALSSTLLCLLGAFLGIWIFHLDLSLTAILGIVSLMGIIVRNAIIMFEYAEELHKKGYSAKEAALESGKRRMRPIFLTSATTAVGVLPMIISRSTLWMPLGVVIFFGTIIAIFFVITVLPVAYWKVYEKKKIQIAIKNKPLLLLALCLLLTSTGYCQQYSLDSCKAMALRNNAQVKNSYLEIEAAKQQKKEAFTNYFPNISLTGAAFIAQQNIVDVDLSSVDINVSTNNPVLNNAIQTLYNTYGAYLSDVNVNMQTLDHGVVAGATLVQPLFAGGRIVHGNQLANVGVQAAQLQAENALKEVLLKTEQSYWLVISLQEKLKTVTQAETLLENLHKDVSGAYRASLVSKNDLLRVELKQSELQSNRLQVENGIILATRALCQQVGIVYSDTVQLTDTLTSPTTPWQLQVNPEEALSNRIEYQLLNMNLQAETLKKKMIIGEALPQIGVGAGYLYNNLLGKNKFNAATFATASIPLSDWWAKSHAIKRQAIKEQIANNNKENFDQLLLLQLHQAWNEVEESYYQVLLAQKTIEQADENLKITTDYYHSGMISLSELLEAQTILRQAKDNYCDKQIAYKIKTRTYLQMTTR